MKAGLTGAVLTAAVLASAAWASAGDHSFSARVVGVHDGDTITVYAARRPQQKVRLVEIDAPENGQPYGQRLRQTLSGLVFGKTVRIESEGPQP